MAKLVSGILGPIRGKVGAVVGASWKGIAYIRSLAASIANPRTAAQIAQRTKFANVVAFAQEILATVIIPLWNRFQTGQSGYNAFVSTNIALFVIEKPDPAADLVISIGKMDITAIDTITVTDASDLVSIDWTDDSGSGFKLATDEAYAIAWREDEPDIAISSALKVRSDGALGMQFDSVLNTGDTVHVYLAFRRADGTIVSNTAYSVQVV